MLKYKLGWDWGEVCLQNLPKYRLMVTYGWKSSFRQPRCPGGRSPSSSINARPRDTLALAGPQRLAACSLTELTHSLVSSLFSLVCCGRRRRDWIIAPNGWGGSIHSFHLTPTRVRERRGQRNSPTSLSSLSSDNSTRIIIIKSHLGLRVRLPSPKTSFTVISVLSQHSTDESVLESDCKQDPLADPL